jgi:hypothetical protein
MPDQPAGNCASRSANQYALGGMMTSTRQPARNRAEGPTQQSARSRIVLRAIRVHTTGRQHESNGHDRDTNSSMPNLHRFLAFCFALMIVR